MDATDTIAITARLSERARLLRFTALTDDARRVAKQCLLDWLGVTIAARTEPLVKILVDEAADEGGNSVASIIGHPLRGTARQAALINGAMGHALDYDDVTKTMGHPTVPVAPVIFALGERDGVSGADLLTAFVAGIETEVAVSLFAGPSHYARGFHGTATYGSFGAAAAAAHLLKLDQSQFQHAMGIAGTQAAGLKAVFGTMCKPLHAGNAAVNGLVAAGRALRGFTSNQAILEAPWGFGATQSDATDMAAALLMPPGGFHIRDTLFKYHAACYLTHSTIAACDDLRTRHKLRPGDIRSVVLGVDPGHLGVCAIADPQTGLQSKFSLVHIAALALSDENSADENLFSDAVAVRPDLVALRNRIAVTTRLAPSFLMSDVRVELHDGTLLRAQADVGIPADDLDLQWVRLTQKFHTLVKPHLTAQAADAIVEFCRTFDRQPGLAPLMALMAQGSRRDRRPTKAQNSPADP